MTTPQERLDALLADVWQPTDALVTISNLESALDDFGFAIVRLTFDASTQPQIIDGMSATEVMVAKATAMKMQDAVEAMRSGGGLSLSSPARQSVIDMLATAGQWPTAVRDAVKALGGVYVKEWQRQGMTVEPTLESLQAKDDTAAVESWFNARSAVVNEGLFNGTITNRQQVLDILGAE